MLWESVFTGGWEIEAGSHARAVPHKAAEVTGTRSRFLPQDIVLGAGTRCPNQRLFRETVNEGKASSSIGCFSSQGCSGRQDFPVSTPAHEP